MIMIAIGNTNGDLDMDFMVPTHIILINTGITIIIDFIIFIMVLIILTDRIIETQGFTTTIITETIHIQNETLQTHQAEEIHLFIKTTFQQTEELLQ